MLMLICAPHRKWVVYDFCESKIFIITAILFILEVIVCMMFIDELRFMNIDFYSNFSLDEANSFITKLKHKCYSVLLRSLSKTEIYTLSSTNVQEPLHCT